MDRFDATYEEHFPGMRDGPQCPVRWMLDRVGERWSLYALVHLHDNGESRFSALRRSLPGVSNRMLARTLEGLVENGLVSRRHQGDNSLYALTDLGSSLMVPMRSLIEWVGQNARQLDESRRKFGLPPLDLPPQSLTAA